MAICGLCGKRIPLLESYLTVSDGNICCECILKNGYTWMTLTNVYGDELREIRCKDFSEWALDKKRKEKDKKAKRQDLANRFNSTGIKFNEIEIDENNKLIWLLDNYYEFNQIISYELYEDNSTIMKGGLGRAFVGDVLLGTKGAFLGAMTRKSSNICQKMEIVVKMIECEKPILRIITLIDRNVRRDSEEYSVCLNKAREIMFMLDIVNGKTNKNRNQEEKNELFSVADEIRKFKSLLDDGIITQEEFDKKKAQLLDM